MNTIPAKAGNQLALAGQPPPAPTIPGLVPRLLLGHLGRRAGCEGRGGRSPLSIAGAAAAATGGWCAGICGGREGSGGGAGACGAVVWLALAVDSSSD
ncbi:unnamed protein product [Lampetra planeri]